jgi:hypothetical protein
MCSLTDADRERILCLENSFSVEEKLCHEAKDNVRLFSLKKSGGLDFSLSHIFRLFSPVPSKTKNREFTVIYL